MQDIADTCDEKISAGGGVKDSVFADCMAVVGAFNEHMLQLYSEYKENIDHILYG
jgi:hypothetical protein